jgi:hypothetical protein
MNPLDKVKNIVDTLIKDQLVSEISEVMVSGFGEVNVKVIIQNETVRVIHLTHTKSVMID